MRVAKLDLLLLAVLVACLGGLAGCTASVQVPEQVRVQVPVPCLEAARRPQKPVLRTESDLLAMDRYRRTLAAWSDLRKHEIYAAELEAIVEGCSRIPARPP